MKLSKVGAILRAAQALIVVGWLSQTWATCVADDAESMSLKAPFDSKQAAAAQRTCAARLRTEVEQRNSIGMTMTLIPPGQFLMGSSESPESLAAFATSVGQSNSKPSDFADEYPQHAVRITQAFRFAKHEVTRANFQAFVTDTGYRTEAETDVQTGGWGWDSDEKRWAHKSHFQWRNVGFSQTEPHPVANVTWNDAQKFCEWLGKKEGQTYRLPTEAEWEYANRAGTQHRYQCGDDPECLARIANAADGTAREAYPDWQTIAAKDGFIYSSPVGSFAANPFGLSDLHGNAWEWCHDYYSPTYYEKSPTNDPTGPTTSATRVMRGGAWSRTPVNARSSARRGAAPSLRHVNIGFRTVLVLATN